MSNQYPTPAARVTTVLSALFIKGLVYNEPYNPDAKIHVHKVIKEFIDLAFTDVKNSNNIFDVIKALNDVKNYSDMFLDFVSQGAKILAWDGDDIEELKGELDNLIELTAIEDEDNNEWIMTRLLTALGGHARLPYPEQIPDDIKMNFFVLACDRRGYCLVGGVEEIKHVDELRQQAQLAKDAIANK